MAAGTSSAEGIWASRHCSLTFSLFKKKKKKKDNTKKQKQKCHR